MSFLAAIGKGHTFEGNDGKKYTISPLTFKELGEFVVWVQYKPYRDAVAAQLPSEVCREVYEECKLGKVLETVIKDEWLNENDNPSEATEEDMEDKLFPIGLDSTVVREQMVSPEGLHHMLILSLSVKHPEFKTKPVNDVINLPKFKELQDLLLVINGLQADEEEEEDEEDEDEEKN